MHDVDQIYIYYKKSQSFAKNKGYRLPKDIKTHIEKMNANNRKNLLDITSKFNTVYHNVDPLEYFNCGFSLFKNLNYHQFNDERIINLYILRDKNAKRESMLSKKALVDSVKFMLKYLKENEKINTKIDSPFIKYCNLYFNGKPAPVSHYINNKISKHFLVWLLKKRYLEIHDSLKNDIPYVFDNFRDLIHDIRSIDDFMHKIKNKITM